MKSIYFSKNPEDVKLPVMRGDTLVVTHDMYSPPKIENAQYLSLKEFKMVYPSIHFTNLVLVGINRIITPSNRCDMVNDFIQTMTRNKNKISIDTTPFIGEPWRLWYHFDVTNNDPFNMPHGYAVETEWKKKFLKEKEVSIFEASNIKNFAAPLVESTIPKLEFAYTTRNVGAKDQQWYEEAKEHIISTNNTPKNIINKLLKMCNKKFGENISFNSYREPQNIFIPTIVPNLGIYRFVLEENIYRKDLYNAVIS